MLSGATISCAAVAFTAINNMQFYRGFELRGKT